MNRCPVIRDLLPLYIEGLSSTESNLLVESHLEACPHCKAEYEAMLPLPKVVPPEEQKIVKALQKAQRKRKCRTIVLITLCLLTVLGVCGLYVKHQYDLHGYMKHRTTVLSAEEAGILCPQILLKKEEMDYLEDPGDVFSLLYTERVIPQEEILPYIESLLPKDATLMEVCVNTGVLSIDYFLPEERVLLSFMDYDGNRTFDHLLKLVSSRPGEGFPESPLSYKATYDILTRTPVYHQTEEVGIAFKLFD